MSSRSARPYWLEDGTETCPSCSHLHVYETQCRCVACDRGICCHCVRVSSATRAVLCPDCEAEGEAEA